MPYSAPTPFGGLVAPVVDGGTGGVEDFERLGEKARGAIVLVETPRLLDVPGLFAQYTHASAVESRAEQAGVAALAYQSSRPSGVLYRQIVARGEDNALPMFVVERDAGMRMLRLLREGRSLEMSVELLIDTGGPFESTNVIGEIRGGEHPEEIVVAGAHLDSWGLGQGALDNGCNVVMLIDVARQIRRLGLTPRRTIRFVLFNGEELGFFGSWGYTRTHLDELDRHVLAQSYDIGSGRIVGYFTNGWPELSPAMERALGPVRGLGPFEIVDIPIIGTDNFDFILQGVANLVANQESANYGPNYHASSDTFDKVDQRQLRLNAAIAAAVTWSFAETDVDWKRRSRSDIQRLIDTTGMGTEMRVFHLMEDWEQGERGRGATSP
jgi:carboxypeptidase Q